MKIILKSCKALFYSLVKRFSIVRVLKLVASRKETTQETVARAVEKQK